MLRMLERKADSNSLLRPDSREPVIELSVERQCIEMQAEEKHELVKKILPLPAHLSRESSWCILHTTQVWNRLAIHLVEGFDLFVRW